MKILILSCNTGEGHNAAGKAIREAAIRCGHTADMLDMFLLSGKKTSHAVGGAYVELVKHMPHAFGMLYKIGMAISSNKHKSPVYYANALMAFFLFGMMVPIFSCLVPMFQIYNRIGLRNTYWALVLPQIGFGLPMCIYLYTGFFKFMPDSLLEAAVIDGATMGTTFRKIVVPMAKNTTMTVLTYNFVFVWNEFTYANTFISSSDMKTLPIGLNDFVGQFGRVDWGSTFAAIVISILPTLIVYFILNRNIIEGMAAGAVKS